MSEDSNTSIAGTAAEGDPAPGPVDPSDIEPEPEPDPVPDAPVGETIVWEPQTWYAITYACRTPGCPNENILRSAPMFYSNNGLSAYIRVVDAADGACQKDCLILTADKLDPQPIEE